MDDPPQSRLGKCKHEVYTPGRKLKQRRRRGTENGLFCARAGDWQRVRQLLNAAQMWPSPKAQRRTCRCAHSNGAEPRYPRLSNEQSKAAPRLRYLLFFVWPAQGRVPGPRRRPRDGAHGTKRGVSFRSSVASREMRSTGLVARRRPAVSIVRQHDHRARGSAPSHRGWVLRQGLAQLRLKGHARHPRALVLHPGFDLVLGIVHTIHGHPTYVCQHWLLP